HVAGQGLELGIVMAFPCRDEKGHAVVDDIRPAFQPDVNPLLQTMAGKDRGITGKVTLRFLPGSQPESHLTLRLQVVGPR
ncbi:MAG: hypothetical protein ACK56I_15110, partial [bacterium]